jgi:hypothetical protein
MMPWEGLAKAIKKQASASKRRGYKLARILLIQVMKANWSSNPDFKPQPL